MQIHVLDRHERRLVPKLVPQIAQHHDRRGEIVLKEVGDVLADALVAVAHGREARPELADQDQAVEAQAQPGADDAGLRGEGQLGELVALVAPGLPEADVAEADGGPGEDGAQAGRREQPGKGFLLHRRRGDEGEEAEEEGEDDGEERAALAVDVGEDARGLALLGERGERA